MSGDAANRDAALLAARIRAELAEIGHVVERATYLLAKATQRNDNDYYDGIALNLHSFYTGIERILEEIARDIDASIPTGQNWHRDLLVGHLARTLPFLKRLVAIRMPHLAIGEWQQP